MVSYKLKTHTGLLLVLSIVCIMYIKLGNHSTSPTSTQPVKKHTHQKLPLDYESDTTDESATVDESDTIDDSGTIEGNDKHPEWNMDHLFSKDGVTLSKEELKEVKRKHFYRLYNAKTAEKFVKYYAETCQFRNFANVAKEERCPCVPPGLEGALTVNRSEPSWDELIAENAQVLPGGEHRPTSCKPLQKIAVIISYRDRERHLKILLRHLHRLLQKQKLHYRIYAAEQTDPGVFNNMALADIAYLEAKKRFKPDCLVFNDVEKLAEDDRHFFMCEDAPLHHSVYFSLYKYIQGHDGFVGGVLAMPPWIFEKANGYSIYNYVGWGGQDDEMYSRLKLVNETTEHGAVRFPPYLSRFTVLAHVKSPDFPHNSFQFSAFNLTAVQKRMPTDGLSNLDYILDSYTEKPLYTHIKATLVSPLLSYTYERGQPACSGQKILSGSFLTLMDCASKCTSMDKCQGFAFLFTQIFKKDLGKIYTCYLYNFITCGKVKNLQGGYRLYRKRRLCKHNSNGNLECGGPYTMT